MAAPSTFAAFAIIHRTPAMYSVAKVAELGMDGRIWIRMSLMEGHLVVRGGLQVVTR
jgi:hypothetical protein